MLRTFIGLMSNLCITVGVVIVTEKVDAQWSDLFEKIASNKTTVSYLFSSLVVNTWIFQVFFSSERD